MANSPRYAETSIWQQALIDSALDAVIVMDEEGLVLDFNPSAEKIFGYSKEEIVGQRMADLIIPPSLRDAHTAGLARLKSTKIAKILGQRLQLPAVRRDGTEFPVELIVVQVDIQPRPVYVGNVRDISERIATEDALRLTQEAMDLAADAVFWVRPDATIHYVNNKACESLGYTREELLNCSVMDFSPEIPDGGWEPHWKRLKSSGHVTVETRHRRKDGTEFPVEISLNFFKSQEQEFNCAFARDITERVQSREALSKAMRETQVANQARSEFLAVVSHEMRTPLNGVLGSIELCLQEELSGEQRSLLELCKKSGNHLKELISDVLDYSQIQAGRFSLQVGLTDLKQTLERIRTNFHQRADEKGLEFRWNVDPDIPVMVWADERRLSQVISNLMQNAIKFTDHGFVGLKADVHHTEDGHLVLYCAVEDSGIGVHEEDRQRIFQRFEQVDQGLTRSLGGVGLGLSICQELVKLMEGNISVHSAGANSGSKFEFTASLKLASEVELAAEKAGDRGERSYNGLEGLQVMVVEDDPASSIVTKRMLEKVGVQVTTAEDGMIAVEKFAVTPEQFDAILMDVMMPNLDGISATQRIRGLQTRDVPIIAMTAHASPEDKQRILDSRMDAFLSKPIEREHLLDVLQSVAESASQKSEMKPPEFPLVDWETLQQRCGDDVELIHQVLRLFQVTCQETLEKLQAAINETDDQGCREAIHKLKGSAANVGAVRLQQLCMSLENEVRQEGNRAAAMRVVELKETVDFVSGHIDERINSAD